MHKYYLIKVEKMDEASQILSKVYNLIQQVGSLGDLNGSNIEENIKHVLHNIETGTFTTDVVPFEMQNEDCPDTKSDKFSEILTQLITDLTVEDGPFPEITPEQAISKIQEALQLIEEHP